jgi:hypothetical protein
MSKKEHTAHESAGSSRPTEKQIAKRAYDLFVARGCTHGHDVEDWLCAEAELRATE